MLRVNRCPASQCLRRKSASQHCFHWLLFYARFRWAQCLRRKSASQHCLLRVFFSGFMRQVYAQVHGVTYKKWAGMLILWVCSLVCTLVCTLSFPNDTKGKRLYIYTSVQRNNNGHSLKPILFLGSLAFSTTHKITAICKLHCQKRVRLYTCQQTQW